MKQEEDLYHLYHDALKKLAKVSGLLMTAMSPSDLDRYFSHDMYWEVMNDYVAASQIVNHLKELGEDVHMGKLITTYPNEISDREIWDTLDYPDKVWGYKK